MADLTQQLIVSIKQAYRTKQAINIVGANSKPFLGRQIPAEKLCVSEHRGILKYQPVELVITARAGTPVQEIQQALAEHRQMLAFEPCLFKQSCNGEVGTRSATIGGTLAANLSGPARPWSGSIRDMVLGVKLINGRAELLNFGGQVMKNVAGYDLARVQAGALGTLGLITEISLKVLPMPEMQRYLQLGIEEALAIRLMNQLSASAKPINGACWMAKTLYIRLAGAEKSVLQCVNQWTEEFGFVAAKDELFWSQLTQYQLPIQQSTDQLWRFSIRSSAPSLGLAGQQLIDWGGALRWVAGNYDYKELQNIAERAGGTVALWSGGDRCREINHPLSPAMQALQQRIKRSFDPCNILNPGRLYTYL